MRNLMMTRILTISCIFLAVATFAVMTVNSTVNVHSSVPQLINPGDEFMVRVSIEKGALKNGAVLQQILPEGFSASAIENEGAQFYFENQMVRFVWEKMSAKAILVVAYKLKAGETVEGIKKINGTFIYAQSNHTAQINLPENIIYVSNDFPISNAEHLDGNTGTLHMQRSIADKKGESSNGFRITMNVNNENESGFASWTEQIPNGYTVEVNAANNAAFSTDGSLIKFNWTVIPAEKSWSFTYTIFPPENKIPVENPELLGIMVYGSTESIKTCIPSDGPIPKQTTAPVVTRQEFNIVPEPPSVTETLTQKLSESDAEPINNTETQTEPASENKVVASAHSSMTLTVQRGIYYRVQIAATKRSPTRDSDFFRSKYQITRPVDMIEQDGWKKYCIGTFARMEPARTFALETRAYIPDAFIVAYRDGQRIPINEAMETLSLSQ